MICNDILFTFFIFFHPPAQFLFIRIRYGTLMGHFQWCTPLDLEKCKKTWVDLVISCLNRNRSVTKSDFKMMMILNPNYREGRSYYIKSCLCVCHYIFIHSGIVYL